MLTLWLLKYKSIFKLIGFSLSTIQFSIGKHSRSGAISKVFIFLPINYYIQLKLQTYTVAINLPSYGRWGSLVHSGEWNFDKESVLFSPDKPENKMAFMLCLLKSFIISWHTYNNVHYSGTCILTSKWLQSTYQQGSVTTTNCIYLTYKQNLHTGINSKIMPPPSPSKKKYLPVNARRLSKPFSISFSEQFSGMHTPYSIGCYVMGKKTILEPDKIY